MVLDLYARQEFLAGILMRVLGLQVHVCDGICVCPCGFGTHQNFMDFFDYTTWLDEELLGEVAVGTEQRGGAGEKGAVLGDKVAVAGFHPGWMFGGVEEDSAIHWEKRSPHPTISIIKSEGILHAQATTQSIAEDNERTLRALGRDAVERRFRSVVTAAGPAHAGVGAPPSP